MLHRFTDFLEKKAYYRDAKCVKTPATGACKKNCENFNFCAVFFRLS